VVSSTPRPQFTPGKDPIPIVKEAGWAPGPVWMGRKSRPHRGFLIQPYLLPYYCYITVHTLFNLPRNRRTEPQFGTVCHYLTVLPPPTIFNTEAFEAVCVTVALRSGRCYLFLCTLRSMVISSLLRLS